VAEIPYFTIGNFVLSYGKYVKLCQFWQETRLLHKEENMKERIRWIDIAKFFGIFAIYIGHFSEAAGKSFYFVFTHHVALFFFISGCMEIFNKEQNFMKYLGKKIKTILIPFWVFAVIAAILTIIQNDYPWNNVKGLIVEVLRGVVRNTFVAGSLWFLTCLFVMQIIFFLIKKVKYKSIMLLISIGCYIVANYVIQPHPLVKPSMYYNVDSALYYLIYYALGYLLFPYIIQLFELDTQKKKSVFWALTFVCIAFAIAVYFGADIWTYIKIPSEAWIITQVVTSCMIIFAYFAIARMVEDVTILAELGKNTLYLCGSEYIVRILLANFASIFSLNMVGGNPLAIYIYTGLMLFVANKYLVPIEKYIINKIVNK